MSVAPRGKPKPNFGDDDSQTPILHVDMDSFFASVEVLLNPDLKGRPVIVGGTGNRGVVTAATYEARAYGVRAGMPIGRARSLCSGAVFIQGRHDVYAEYSGRVMKVLRSLSPRVEPISIDEAFMDVGGARRQLGSPVRVAYLVRAKIKDEVGLPASVGVASTKSVAKIASAHAKPDGLLLVPADRTIEFLHPLPIGALWGVGRKTGEVLQTRGVDTIGQLANTPVQVLTGWLGAASAHALHALAWGRDTRPVGEREREKSISMERTFPQNVTSREELAAFVLAAAHDCAHRLRSIGMLAWTVTVKVRDGEFNTVSRSKTLLAPTDVGREVAETAEVLVDAIRFPKGGVRLAGVGVSSLVEDGDAIPMLLDDNPKVRATELAMDAAQARFGIGAIRPASLLKPQDLDGENHGSIGR
ncbi:DNA polymerase IV [Actinomyces minihominis]|uniref:DNA polymerase IV n=1 Tax=Actinomyces minihominis TaxID=2002838 RepID=UPI000C06CA77|nr:DNA polymerase IV [Actinomyces minihominis]